MRVQALERCSDAKCLGRQLAVWVCVRGGHNNVCFEQLDDVPDDGRLQLLLALFDPPPEHAANDAFQLGPWPWPPALRLSTQSRSPHPQVSLKEAERAVLAKRSQIPNKRENTTFGTGKIGNTGRFYKNYRGIGLDSGKLLFGDVDSGIGTRPELVLINIIN